MKNIIVARLVGGLGNQLFTYSAARRLAIVNNAELVIDDLSGFKNDSKYRRFSQIHNFNIKARAATPSERLIPFSRLRRGAIKWISAKKDFANRKYLTQEFIELDPRLLSYKVKGRVFLEGYWQSEEYFKDIASTIMNDLKITAPQDRRNLVLKDQMAHCESVAIHVRFFDKPNEKNRGNNVDPRYYDKAIAEVETKIPNAHFFLFSDSPSYALKLLPIDTKRITVVDINDGDAMAYADLWLMSHCKHYVIANSTFSWWGAWLSNNPEKIVISPGRVRGSDTEWGFTGLIPEDWKVIST